MELYHPVEHKHRGIELLATEKNVSMSIVILKTWSMTKKKIQGSFMWKTSC